MELFVDSRSRNAVIKRMIELHLIADRSEILPSKRKKSRKSMPSNDSGNSDSSDDDNSDDENTDTRRVKVTVKTVAAKKAKSKPSNASAPRKLSKVALNVADVKRILSEVDDDIKQHFEWIQESLNDAAEDVEETDASEDPDDGVPLVPFTVKQKDAFDNVKFKELLTALGLEQPDKTVVCILLFCSFIKKEN